VTQQQYTHVPDGFDVVVSFVLFKTDAEEVSRAVRQACANKSKIFVILVDNSVPPLQLPQFDPARVSVITTHANLGYGRGHNRAVSWAKGKSRYHIVMNTDLTYEQGVIDDLVGFMDAHPNAGLCMPRVRYPDGRIQRLCRLLPSPLDLIGRRFFGWSLWAKSRNERYEFHDWNYDSVASFPFLSGCFMMMRSSVLHAVGGFDERYFLYAEDLDLSRRIHACSETLFVPHVEVVHEYRSEGSRGIRRLLYGIKSLSQYFHKWGWFVDPERDAINQRTLAALSNGSDN
jgi:GT2 family glycosyltransferase